MPLLAATLERAVLRLTDARDPAFVGWPPSAEMAAVNWANAAREYMLGLTSPVPLPGTVDAAAEAFRGAFQASLGGGAGAALQAGWGAAVGVLAAGCAPFVAVPPVGSALTLTPGAPTSDPTVPAAQLASTVDAWMRTGVASIPPAPPAPWA